jgi:phage terminase small subunit
MDGTKENKPKFTAKQEQFINEYLIDFNATQAAIRAGYSVDTAYQIGHENLRKPDIKKEVQKRSQELLKDQTELAAKTIRELETISRSDITDYIIVGTDKKITKIKDLSQIDTRAISALDVNEKVLKRDSEKEITILERTIKLKLWDKARGLDTLSKVTGLQKQELKLSGSLDMNIKFDLESWKEKIQKRFEEEVEGDGNDIKEKVVKKE